jgi:hypothetical protein
LTTSPAPVAFDDPFDGSVVLAAEVLKSLFVRALGEGPLQRCRALDVLERMTARDVSSPPWSRVERSSCMETTRDDCASLSDATRVLSPSIGPMPPELMAERRRFHHRRGRVVTRDIPAGVVAVGVPCRVLRAL